MFESLSNRKDLYDEPSPLNGLTTYRISRQLDGSKTFQELDSTLSEHGLQRARPEKNSQNIFQALALALGYTLQEEHNILSRIRNELSEFMQMATHKLPLRLQELRTRKDTFVRIMDNPGQEDFHKYIFDVCSFAFKVKVIVCSIAQNSRALIETIYANRFRDEIRILKTGPAKYEGLQKKVSGADQVLRNNYPSSHYKNHHQSAEEEYEEEDQNLIPMRRMHRPAYTNQNWVDNCR